MASQTAKNQQNSPAIEEDTAVAEMDMSSEKICFSRYNSPFWQVVVVSLVAFG
jgi:hypothetical protein